MNMETKPLTIDFNNITERLIGFENGLRIDQLEAFSDRIAEIHNTITNLRKEEKLGFFKLPYNVDIIEKISIDAKFISKKFHSMVVLGIGGSSLGPRAVYDAVKPSNGLKLYFPDNVDSEMFNDLLEKLDLDGTCFNVITKSGGTVETISQLMIIYNILQQKFDKKSVQERIIATTDPRRGMLRKLSEEEKWTTYEVPPNVGGRFSILTPVGLFPLACAGVDIKALCRGAAYMDEQVKVPELFKNPAYFLGTALYMLNTKKHKSVLVTMPYANALTGMADWYLQLWGESLGKRYSRTGDVVNTGQTPVRSLGATDQHSQLQLYVEGPNDKVVMFIIPKKFRKDIKIPEPPDFIKDSVGYLTGKNMSDLISAEYTGTKLALVKAERPNLTIEFDEICEQSLGAFLYLMEYTTLFSGELYNINAFDQPGVEEGKQFAFGLLGREGYEHKAAEIDKLPECLDKFIV